MKNKKYFVYNKESCWLSKYTRKEYKNSRNKFKEQFL